MAKKETTTEEVNNVFDGFKFLDQTPTKREAIKEVLDDELSAEEIEALNKSAKELANKSGGKGANNDSQEEDDKSDKTDGGSGETKKGAQSKEVNKENEVEEENGISAYARWANERGLLHLEENEVLESEDDLERVTANTIKRGIAQDRERLPEDAQKFLEFVDNGGKPSDFHKYYYGESSFEDFSIESEENQEYVIREALQLEEYDAEEIEDQINLYKDSDKLASKAATHLKKLQKVEKDQKKLLVEAQKEHAKQQETKRDNEWKEFRSGLMDKESIGGFKMTPKSKNELWDYMTKVVDRKTGETAYQIDSNKNEDARYVFAYLLKNNWDVKSLERMVESKKVGELRGKLGSFTDTRAKQKGPASKVTTEESNPFARFKDLL